MATRQGPAHARHRPDQQGYTLDLMGNHQRLQLRSWASELEKSAERRLPVGARRLVPHEAARRRGRADKARPGARCGRRASRSPRSGRSRSRTRCRSARAAPGIYGDSVTDIDWDNLHREGERMTRQARLSSPSPLSLAGAPRSAPLPPAAGARHVRQHLRPQHGLGEKACPRSGTSRPARTSSGGPTSARRATPARWSSGGKVFVGTNNEGRRNPKLTATTAW